MNGRVSKLIRRYATTYAGLAQGSGRTMERIVKRKWNQADKREKRRIEFAMEERLRSHGR